MSLLSISLSFSFFMADNSTDNISKDSAAVERSATDKAGGVGVVAGLVS